jgi:myosin-1
MQQQRPTSQTAAVPKPAPQAYSTPVAQNHARNDSTTSTASARVAPPPPPPPPQAAKAAQDTYRAIYDFNGQTETELSLQKDEVVVITQKADNGKSAS